MKNSQISIFIIISLILIISFVFFLSVSDNFENTDNNLKNPIDFSFSKDLVQTCLEESSKLGVYSLGLNGGYFEYFEEGTPIDLLNIPYYYDGENILIPSKEELKENLELITNHVFEICLENFKDLEETGYKLDYDMNLSSLNLEILEEKIIYDLDFPYTISLNGKSESFRKFSYILDFNLFSKYEAVKEYIYLQEEYPQSVLLSDLNDLSLKYEFNFEYFSPKENSMLYRFKFPNDIYKNEAFTYQFAVKYDWGEEE